MCTNLCVKNVTNNSTFLQILYIRSERAQEWFWKKLNFKSSPLICYLCPCPVYPQPFTPFPNYLLENRTQLLWRHPSKEGLSLSHILRSLSGAHAFCLGAQKISCHTADPSRISTGSTLRPDLEVPQTGELSQSG